MTHASLFSGIGGPEVAAEMLGWTNLFHCEINPFGRAVLAYHFPESVSYEDITKTDFTQWRGRVDVLTGGFPCQPFSYAGKRGGADDDRYLWPQMCRAIQECQPTWVVGENVAGLATMVEQCEITELGAQPTLFEAVEAVPESLYEERGRYTIDRICQDLEAIGYAVQPVLIPACGVGAPHRRDRIFIIGHRNNVPRNSDDLGGRLSEREVREGKDTITEGVRTVNSSAAVTQNAMRSRQLVGHDGEQGSERNERNAGAGDSERICREASRATAADTYGKRREEPEQSGRRAHSPEEGAGMDDRTERYGCDGFATDTDNEMLERRQFPDTKGHRQSEDGSVRHFRGGSCKAGSRNGNATDTSRNGLEGMLQREEYEDARRTRQTAADTSDTIRSISPGERWNDFPTVSPVHRGNDGLPFDVHNLTIPFTQWRTESLKAYGNAIVPQVMYEIFRAIETITKNNR